MNALTSSADLERSLNCRYTKMKTNEARDAKIRNNKRYCQHVIVTSLNLISKKPLFSFYFFYYFSLIKIN